MSLWVERDDIILQKTSKWNLKWDRNKLTKQGEECVSGWKSSSWRGWQRPGNIQKVISGNPDFVVMSMGNHQRTVSR